MEEPLKPRASDCGGRRVIVADWDKWSWGLKKHNDYVLDALGRGPLDLTYMVLWVHMKTTAKIIANTQPNVFKKIQPYL